MANQMKDITKKAISMLTKAGASEVAEEAVRCFAMGELVKAGLDPVSITEILRRIEVKVVMKGR